MMFQKILIANRGEIACRVARTARRMGIGTVAVYSDADADAPHVQVCDEAAYIGPSPASESYLRVDRIVDAARRTGAQAIHPGYGFLSENAEFAEALEKAGIVFIGPASETIRAMGSKSAAKDLMEAAGVPTTPGYQGASQTLTTFRAEARRIGYPVLLKASAGGGGKGMRRVDSEEDLRSALESARREARSAFGDDRLLIEKYITRARHVEVQVFGDGRGNVVHMFERDCSIQRRHQKVIEEAPAPGLPPQVRQELLAAGVEAARAVKYRGAGTVEFLYDGKDAVYFMEMNTRLQVEHPVSEMITGQDFVEWQLRIAAGEGLPLSQDEIVQTGAAVEARLYAEAPGENFAPSVGTVTTLRLPAHIARVDSGVSEGQEIGPFYDPMIAKIVTHASSRTEAIAQLTRALCETHVAGLESNSTFLYRLASSPAFERAELSTRFIDEHAGSLFAEPEIGAEVIASCALWMDRRNRTEPDAGSADGFRLNQPFRNAYWIGGGERPARLQIIRRGNQYEAVVETDTCARSRREGHIPQTVSSVSFAGTALPGGEVRIEIDSVSRQTFVAPHLEGARIWLDGNHVSVDFPDVPGGIGSTSAASGSLQASMPGVITMLCATEGHSAKKGEALLVMEAMKMEHTVYAPADGRITGFRFRVGDQVKSGDLLVDFEAC